MDSSVGVVVMMVVTALDKEILVEDERDAMALAVEVG